jgi:hypothetical protein
MIVESIQNVYSITPLYTQQTVYTLSVDPKTNKEYQEIITYKVYNNRAEIEEHYQPKVDLRA